MSELLTIIVQQLGVMITTIITVLIITFAVIYLIQYFFDKFFLKVMEKWEKRAVEREAFQRIIDIRNKYG